MVNADNGVTQLVTKEDMLQRLVESGIDGDLAKACVDGLKSETKQEVVMSKVDEFKAVAAVKTLQLLMVLKKAKENFPTSEDLGRGVGNALNLAQKAAAGSKDNMKGFFSGLKKGYQEARKK